MEAGIRKELHRVLDKMIDENERVGMVTAVNPVFEDGKVFRYEKYEYILNYFTRKDNLF